MTVRAFGSGLHGLRSELWGSALGLKMFSNVLYERGNQRGAAGEFRDQDGFVGSVGAFTDAAETVESGNTQSSRKVSVGASSHSSFFELPPQLLRNPSRLVVKTHHAASALHGRTIHSAFEFNFAFAIDWFEGAQLAFNLGRVFHAGQADIERGGSFGGNDIDACATLHEADVQGDTALQVS